MSPLGSPEATLSGISPWRSKPHTALPVCPDPVDTLAVYTAPIALKDDGGLVGRLDAALVLPMIKIEDQNDARGELDEALHIRRDEQLPVFERLGDLSGRSVTLYATAMALVRADGIAQGRIQEIHGALSEAFAIATRLDIPEGIGAAGVQLAQVLAIRELFSDAPTILDQAETAFGRLGQAAGVRPCHQLRERIGSKELAGDEL